ncbi:hypothetical protein Tco_0826988 [Tanacetum coccineum]
MVRLGLSSFIEVQRLSWSSVCVCYESRDSQQAILALHLVLYTISPLKGHGFLCIVELERSPTTSVPSLTHVSRSIAPTPANLLPPRKRFRDSYSPEDSREEHMEVDIADAEAVADVGISDGVVAHTEDDVGIGVRIATSVVRKDEEEFEAKASVADTREIIVDPLAIGDSSESSR